MTSDHKVVFLNQSKSVDRGQRLLDDMERFARERLTAQLRVALDSLDDTLFQRTEQEEHADTANMYFDAMRQVRLQRQAVEADFLRRMSADIRGLTGRQPEPSAEGPLVLSLVGHDELETNIAVEGMVNKARSRFGDGIEHLRQRVSALLGLRAIGDEDHPFDPQQIAKAFASAAESMEMDIRVQLMMLKLFDKHVMSELGEVYDELNGMLARAGVLPELKTATMARPKPKPAPSSSPAVAAPIAAEDGHPDAGGAEFAELLHQLLASRKYGGAPSAHDVPRGPVASLGDVVSALSALQRDGEFAAPQTRAVSEADLKALLVQALQRVSSGDSKGIGRSEDDTIDIVGMLFDVILSDPQLPISIKALIGRLQIPVLKVALLDKAFFSSRKHPARQLINELAQAAVGWVEPAHLERDPFYRKVDYVVERVLSDFDDNVELFHELLSEFLAFVEEERERIRLIEARTRQAAEGKVKVDSAKARVDREIVERLSAVNAPEMVHTLLRDAWSKVLFITLLKEGEESDPWRRQLAVVDRLLWSVQPKTSAAERKELLVEIPGLLHELREGLNSILFNPFEMTKLFKALEAEHIRCLAVASVEMVLPGQEAPEPRPVPMAEAPPTPVPVVEMPLAAPEPELPLSDELAEYVVQLQEMPVGTWLEFVQANGNRMRAKLSARLNEGRRLIFVNRAGFKLADKQIEELAGELEARKAVILDDNLLFDKALETVIGNLRDLRAGQ